MFKDILVVLGAKGAAARYVLSFASHFEARVTAVWPAGNSVFDAIANAPNRNDLLAGDEAVAEHIAAGTLREFVERARHYRVEAHMIPIAATDLERGQPRNLPHFARAFDLVVVEQPTPEQNTFAGGLIGSIVSGCGRPVLATPYIQSDPASFDNVVVAWDASATVARALGDALPILVRAKSVEIVTVGNGEADPDLPGGAEVVRHLARHGIHAVFREIPGGIAAADMLLSHVADSGADLMVTGAYGHSRLAETLIGGATRTFLESMTIPLLMSH